MEVAVDRTSTAWDVTDDGPVVPRPGWVKSFVVSGALAASVLSGTGSAAAATQISGLTAYDAVTGSGGVIVASGHRPNSSTANAVALLRDRSGLSWEQLARLFGVSRRSLHKWAAGGTLNSRNAERLAELSAVVGAVPGGPAEVRAFLLAPGTDGRTPFQRLIEAVSAEASPVDGYTAVERLGGLRDGDVTITGDYIEDPDLEADWSSPSG
jgi:transcriptional regulator with XRE-family HTH domain